MSHSINNGGNASRFHYLEYLSHKDEPLDVNFSGGVQSEVEDDLLRSNFFGKRRFRQTARRLRQETA